MREIDFLDLVSRPKKVEEDRLVHALLAEFEVVPVNRRFSAVFRRYIEPGAAGGQNVQDAVDQAAGVTPGSANVRLCWGEVFLNNLPEIIVNFPECHDSRFYLRGLIIIGSPQLLSSDEFEVDTAKLSKLSVARLDEQFIHNRIKRYEEIIGPLCGILTTLVWFDDEGRYSKTIPKVIEQATIEHNFTSASSHLRDLQFYPGLLLFYSTCITALERRNYKVLSEIVRNSRVSTRHERAYAIHRLSGMKIFENISLEILNLNEVEKSDSEEDYVYKVVHSYAHNYLPESKMFRELQTLFEFIVALISIDLATLDTNYLAHHRVEWFNRQCSLINTLNSPIPELVERLNGSRMKLSPLHDFFSEADMYQEEWDFLKHGLFRGSYERFNECYFKFLQIRF